MWFYLMLQCDNVGVWKEDCELSSYIIKGKAITKEQLLDVFKDQVKIFNGKKVWLTDFCDFQWGQLKEEDVTNKPHQSYIRLLKGHGLWNEYKKRFKVDKPKKVATTSPGDKARESFEIFWEEYHTVTAKRREDKAPAFKHWKQLSYEEKVKAFRMIGEYSKTNENMNYLKKARTYIADKTFNDEFVPVGKSTDGVLKGDFHDKPKVHA